MCPGCFVLSRFFSKLFLSVADGCMETIGTLNFNNICIVHPFFCKAQLLISGYTMDKNHINDAKGKISTSPIKAESIHARVSLAHQIGIKHQQEQYVSVLKINYICRVRPTIWPIYIFINVFRTICLKYGCLRWGHLLIYVILCWNIILNLPNLTKKQE